MTRDIILILHDIRSVHNVGAIFRTGDAVGVSEIILSGYTPTPLDRFGRKRGDFAKTALGAEETVPWHVSDNVLSTLLKLKERGYVTVALEQDTRAIPYKKFRGERKMAVVLGNEVGGIPQNVLEICEAVINIPMRGKKESLNVSVAAGVVLYELSFST